MTLSYLTGRKFNFCIGSSKKSEEAPSSSWPIGCTSSLSETYRSISHVSLGFLCPTASLTRKSLPRLRTMPLFHFEFLIFPWKISIDQKVPLIVLTVELYPNSLQPPHSAFSLKEILSVHVSFSLFSREPKLIASVPSGFRKQMPNKESVMQTTSDFSFCQKCLC